MIMSYISEKWTYLYKDVFKENDYQFMMQGTALFNFTLFWGLSVFFMFVDKTGRPGWMINRKIQRGQHEPVEKSVLWKALKIVVFNQIIVSGVCLWLMYPLQQYMGCSVKPEHLPTILQIVRHIFFIALAQEFIFFYMHRLFHWGPLYRRVHKVHHEFTAPMGLTCVYAHPLEHIFVNLMSITLPPALMGSHMLTINIWYAIAEITTILGHSGYTVKQHDIHHSRFNVNYGSLGFLDWLHGSTPTQRKRQLQERLKKADKPGADDKDKVYEGGAKFFG